MNPNKASQPARFVSNGIYWVSQQPPLEREVPPDLARYTAEITRRLEIDRSIFGADAARRLLLCKAQLMQVVSIPGIYLHQLIRKRYIESIAREILTKGARQLVVIGARFDTLRLGVSAEIPVCRVIEGDHPGTQQVKRAALEEFRLPIGHCHFVPADLSEESLTSALSQSPAYDPTEAPLFIAEGLTMYLDELKIRALLSCSAAQNQPSKFLFTYMQEATPKKYHFQHTRPATLLWLALRKERFTWGIRPAALSAFLGDAGFRLQEHCTSKELRPRFLTEANHSAVLAVGENIALAAQVQTHP